MEPTLFQRIINREIPATFEYEDDFCVAIRDIAPAAPLHLLVIPRSPIRGIDAMTDADEALVGHLYNVGRLLAEQHGVHQTGYRLVTNVGADGGQTVPHLHVHLLAGEPLGAMRTAHHSHVPGSQGTAGSSHSVTTGSHGMVRDAGITVLIAIVLAALFNAANPRGIPWIKPTYEHVAMTDDELLALLGNNAPQSNLPVANSSTSIASTAEPAPASTQAVSNAKTPDAATSPSATPSQPSVKPEAPKASTEPPAFQPQPGVVREIGYDAFVKILDTPHFLIDARTAEAYAKGHIPGAVNYYGGEVQVHIPAMLSRVPRDRVVVVYCDGGQECELSHHVADALKGFGYGPILIYMGGWNEWEKRGRK
jgi:histidine triad (HIT) family protein